MQFIDNVARKIDINHGTHTRISAIEGLRAFAVLLVFMVHYTTLIKPWVDVNKIGATFYDFLHYYGNFGVELFFIISGYLIYSIVIKHNFNVADYLVKRIQRIYPSFIVILMIYIALCFAVPSENKLPQSILPQLLYIAQNLLLLPGVFQIKPIITVSWTLSYEMLYYLFLPLFIAIFNFRKLDPNIRKNCIIFVLFSYWLICIIFNISVSRISLFCLGAFAYEVKNTLIKEEASNVIGMSSIILSLFSSYIFIYYNYKLPIIHYILNSILIFIFYLCSSLSSNGISKVLTSKYIRLFGNISYSYFLVHGLTLKFFFFVFNKLIYAHSDLVVAFYCLMPVCFILTLMTAIIFYLLVEYPLSLKKPLKNYMEFQSLLSRAVKCNL